MINKKFNSLTVLKKIVTHDKNHSYYLCQCDCGNQKIIRSDSIRSGHTKSCGCENIKKFIARTKTHGMSNTKEYHCWENMLARCKNKNHQSYRIYGGRCISVCDRWKTFENFFSDMGKSPKNTSLDRIDVNGNYEPSNCRWATSDIQAANKRPLPAHNRLNLAGKRFSRLVFIKPIAKNKENRMIWQLKCDCGSIIQRVASEVKRGNIKSCGCLRRKPSHPVR